MQPMQQSLRCQYCGGMFQSQHALIQHMREAHKSTLQGQNPLGHVRPVGAPMPGQGVRRNLYAAPGQPQPMVRRNRHENNSDAPIAIDASPPPVDSPQAGTSGETSANANSNETSQTLNMECTQQQDGNHGTSDAQQNQTGTDAGQSVQPDDGAPGSVRSDNAGSRPPSQAGSQHGSHAGSTAGGATAAKSGSEGSDTEGYHSPAVAGAGGNGGQKSGRDSVASGLSESESANLPSPTNRNEAQGSDTPPPVLQKEEPVTPTNAINIAPASTNENTVATEEQTNIFEQLQSTFDDLADLAKTATKTDQKPPVEMSSSQNPFEIKPEGPVGSEIFGGQQMFESQNVQPVVTHNNQPVQFIGSSQAVPPGTSIVTVAPPQQGQPPQQMMPPSPGGMPPGVGMPPHPQMAQQQQMMGQPPQMQGNPYMQQQQPHPQGGFPPAPHPQNIVRNQAAFGNGPPPPPGFNGYFQ